MDLPERQSERALVAKAVLRDEVDEEKPLAEIMSLAETAGAEVVDTVQQRLTRPHPATYLRRGKVEQIAARAAEFDVDVIIVDSDLSPAQARNLEKITSRKVVDRSELIMDIFSQRARTRQAKLQVELAQLRYSLPRLKRLWTHLSRFEGGIGMRGPGETQLEEDKRIIRHRIQHLKRRLKKLEGPLETALEHRSREFVIGLVGYTNAGKSTLLNRLTGSHELVEDKLFATLDTRTRKWVLNPNRYVLLTDTVGFIRKLPHHLVASFHATLAETRTANLLLHVVDASSPAVERQIATVRRVLGGIDCHDKETWILFNKWDNVPSDRIIDARYVEEKVAAESSGQTFHVSAHTGENLDVLTDALIERLREQEEEIELFLPHSRGDVVAYLRENGHVLESEYSDGGVAIRARISRPRLEKLKSLYPAGFPPSKPEPWEADSPSR
jgi:GTP-binding protein HflX